MEPFAPFVRKSMCGISTPTPDIPLLVQFILVNTSGFHVFPSLKGKGSPVITNALALLQALRVSAACFCNCKACFGENECKHICIPDLRCRKRLDLGGGGTHTCMYICLSLAFKGGHREIMDTAPTCLCMGKSANKTKNSAGKGRHWGEAWPMTECWCDFGKPRYC